MPANRNDRLADQLRVDREVGARVRRRRKDLKLSQCWLGAQVGVSFQQIQKYENGKNRVSASALVAIADALSISAAALLTGLGAAADEWPPSVNWGASAEGARAYAALQPLGPDAFDAILATARAVGALQPRGRAA